MKRSGLTPEFQLLLAGVQPPLPASGLGALPTGDAAFDRHAPKKNNADSRRIEALEQKLRRKDEVLGELMEEHIALKKELGEL